MVFAPVARIPVKSACYHWMLNTKDLENYEQGVEAGKYQAKRRLFVLLCSGRSRMERLHFALSLAKRMPIIPKPRRFRKVYANKCFEPLWQDFQQTIIHVKLKLTILFPRNTAILDASSVSISLCYLSRKQPPQRPLKSPIPATQTPTQEPFSETSSPTAQLAI